MESLGKFLVLAGITLGVVGAILWSGFGKSWLGRLPGDIHIEREGLSFYFPIVTCILISLVLTILWNIFRR
ncbi:MAG TPA: DUF2905 domain-containing protein [Terrimicrobiaceae bacterium]